MSDAQQSFRERGRLRRRLLRFGLILAGGYIFLVVVFFFLQKFLIFPAPRFPVGNWEFAKAQPWIEEIEFESEDGCRLVGWYAQARNPRGIALFHHGNGENVAMMDSELELLVDRYGLSVFAYDYRGYGRSEGSPTEGGIYMDGRAAMRALNRRTGTTPEQVIVFGRSLGGAMACEVASSMGARALVLQSTFDSLEEVAARLYWWLPVRLLLKFPLRSVGHIRDFQGPLLQSHGINDAIVPLQHARRLFDSCPARNKSFIELPESGHNDVLQPEYLDALQEFLESLDGLP